MTYGVPPLYNPFGQPTPRPTLTPEPSEATAGQKRCAKLAGAQWICSDGYYCYRWNNSIIEQKQWYGSYYSMNWWPTELKEMPEGAIKVEQK